MSDLARSARRLRMQGVGRSPVRRPLLGLYGIRRRGVDVGVGSGVRGELPSLVNRGAYGSAGPVGLPNWIVVPPRTGAFLLPLLMGPEAG
jgi:hypothetical protein